MCTSRSGRLESRATTPEDLHRDFDLLGEFTHRSLADFVIEYFLRQGSWLTRLHHAITIGTLAAAITVGVIRELSLVVWLRDFALAFGALFVIVLPLHELIHALAYRMVGARDIRWDYSARLAAVWVIAHRFVCRRGPFVLVALAPWVLLNAILVFGAIVWPQYAVFLLCLLLWHHQGTAGDLALLNFVWRHRLHGFWTYDDAELGKSFFYGRRNA